MDLFPDLADCVADCAAGLSLVCLVVCEFRMLISLSVTQQEHLFLYGMLYVGSGTIPRLLITLARFVNCAVILFITDSGQCLLNAWLSCSF